MEFDSHRRRLLIDWYDILHQNPGEVEALLTLAGPQPGHLIESGCGTGRVALAFAMQGWRVTAFDIEPRMLELAKAKASRLAGDAVMPGAAVTWHVCDMRQGWPGTDADLAVIAFNTLLMCASVSEVESTLRACRRSLRTGGRCFVSLIRLSAGIEGVMYDYGVRSDGSCLYLARSSYRRVAPQVIMRSYEVTQIDEDGAARCFFTEWRALDIGARAIRDIAMHVGFRVSRACGGYDGEQLDWENEPRRCILELESA